MESSFLLQWLIALSERQASDLYLTHGARPTLRGADGMETLSDTPLDDADLARIVGDLTSADQQGEFAQACEFNMSMDLGPAIGRFRVNLYRQRQHSAVVVRRITAEVPTLSSLGLPLLLGELCCEARGLILMVGGTGSGKSTTLAAMVDHRNTHGHGHILTIEDPVEYIHAHKQCIVSQREVGTDTHDFDAALKNALRQRPDVIQVGEIRDRSVMRHALNIAETGHLALATLHANNADQAIERIVNFYDLEERRQVLLNLSFNLRGLLSQRLVRRVGGGRAVALEIMLNRGRVPDLIRAGDTRALKAEIAAGTAAGMRTFDQDLARLWREGVIDRVVALAECDDRDAICGLVSKDGLSAADA